RSGPPTCCTAGKEAGRSGSTSCGRGSGCPCPERKVRIDERPGSLPGIRREDRRVLRGTHSPSRRADHEAIGGEELRHALSGPSTRFLLPAIDLEACDTL